jgi:hypothetical protein
MSSQKPHKIASPVVRRGLDRRRHRRLPVGGTVLGACNAIAERAAALPRRPPRRSRPSRRSRSREPGYTVDRRFIGQIEARRSGST